MRRYTKANLEELVSMQLENRHAMHDLLIIMKHQNELLTRDNKKLEEEIAWVKQRLHTPRKRK